MIRVPALRVLQERRDVRKTTDSHTAARDRARMASDAGRSYITTIVPPRAPHCLSAKRSRWARHSTWPATSVSIPRRTKLRATRKSKRARSWTRSSARSRRPAYKMDDLVSVTVYCTDLALVRHLQQRIPNLLSRPVPGARIHRRGDSCCAGRISKSWVVAPSKSAGLNRGI